MKPFTIAGIGELLWDILPTSENLGGAPANFAYHVNALGAEGITISTIGDDERGRRALALLRHNGLDTSCISIVSDYPTGYVNAELDENGVATYHFPDEVAWDHLRVNNAAKARKDNLDAVCFGTLAQRAITSRTAIRGFLHDLPASTIRVCDLNLRAGFYHGEIVEPTLHLASVLKLNDEELNILSDMLNLPADTDTRFTELLNRYRLDLIILTRGEKGSILHTALERSDHPGLKAETLDTIGAGDSFTAATVVGLLLNRPLAEINEKANNLAAYVCSRPGATPPIPPHLRY